MKNGQCPKCDSQQIRSNIHRKFPGFHTMPVSSGNGGDRYAPLDIYVCATCGYVESYVAKAEDISYIKDKWAQVEGECDRPADLKMGTR